MLGCSSNSKWAYNEKVLEGYIHYQMYTGVIARCVLYAVFAFHFELLKLRNVNYQKCGFMMPFHAFSD